MPARSQAQQPVLLVEAHVIWVRFAKERVQVVLVIHNTFGCYGS